MNHFVKKDLVSAIVVTMTLLCVVTGFYIALNLLLGWSILFLLYLTGPGLLVYISVAVALRRTSKDPANIEVTDRMHRLSLGIAGVIAAYSVVCLFVIPGWQYSWVAVAGILLLTSSGVAWICRWLVKEILSERRALGDKNKEKLGS